MTKASSRRQAGAPIRIIQITDFHLLADPTSTMMGINTEASFQAVLNAVRQNHGPPDLVLLTGDLVQEPTPNAYRRLKNHLKTLQAPCYCLPGNHDDLGLMKEFLTQGHHVAFQPQILLDGWQIVCLDSTIPGDPGGYLTEEQLLLLELLLADQPERFALVCLHHSPLLTGSRWLDTMRLSNSDQLFAIIDRYPSVRGVIFGHIHQALDKSRNGVRLAACPSTCFQFKPNHGDFALDPLPPGYRWLELCSDGDVRTEVERLNEVPAGLDIASAGY